MIRRNGYRASVDASFPRPGVRFLRRLRRLPKLPEQARAVQDCQSDVQTSKERAGTADRKYK